MDPMMNIDCGRCTAVTTAAPCMGTGRCPRAAASRACACADADNTATSVFTPRVSANQCLRAASRACACADADSTATSAFAPCACADAACPDTREKALRRVQQYGFMTDDLRLFLNTHAGCGEALAALKRYIALEKAEKEEYENRYGSLTLETVATKRRYDWIDCPWPWHVEE